MPELQIDDRDMRVFREYGRTMFFVQSFEFGLQQLLQLQRQIPPDLGFEEAWAKVEKIFAMTAGQTARRLDVPDDLAEVLQIAVNTRNTLAHEYLMLFRMDRAINGDGAVENAVSELQEIAGKFQAVTESISARSDALLRAQGIDPDENPISPERARELWQETFEEPPPESSDS